jgi:hypothetical protein
MLFRWKNKNKSAGADLLLESIDPLPLVQNEREFQKKAPGDEVDRFLEQYSKNAQINKPPKSPSWVNWVFIPLIATAILGALHVLILDKTSSDSLKDKALSGLLAGLTGSIGFYAGKK